MNKNACLRVLQISDTHLFGQDSPSFFGIDTTRSLKSVIEQVRQLEAKPDLVLVTGDLSQDETKDSYWRLSECLSAIDCPVYCLPGNHDIKDTMELAFAEKPGRVLLAQNVICKPWQIILLDTALEGRPEGRLAETELERLDKELAANADHFAIIALHHPPVPINVEWLDNIALTNEEDFLYVIKKHKTVRTVLFGHAHQEFAQEEQGINWLCCPSTAVQFKKSAKFGIDDLSPGWRYLEFYADGTSTSRVGRVKNYEQKANPKASGY